MKIGVIGAGRLGICFALLVERAGYQVLASDNREDYIKDLRAKKKPIKKGIWINKGRQPPKGFAPFCLISFIVSVPCFCLSSLYLSFISFSSGVIFLNAAIDLKLFAVTLNCGLLGGIPNRISISPILLPMLIIDIK